MSLALSASCAPGTTKIRLSRTALSMIWRKLVGIERLSHLEDVLGGQNPAAPDSSAVCPPRLVRWIRYRSTSLADLRRGNRFFRQRSRAGTICALDDASFFTDDKKCQP